MALSIRTILVPIDFGDTSEYALDAAIDLAAVIGAKIHLVHVYQVPVYAFPDAGLIAGPEVSVRLSEAAQKGLQAVTERFQHRGVPLSSTLRQGSPHEEVLAAAREVDADLIVMGTHGRSGLAHALLGSVTERVVRTSTVPVLTIRHRHASSSL